MKGSIARCSGTLAHTLLMVSGVSITESVCAADSNEMTVYTASVSTMSPQINSRQSLDSAWWTGPLFAATPTTLSAGRFDIEPFFYDTVSDGQYDGSWSRKSAPRSHDVRSLWDFMYGVTDTFMVELLPRFGDGGSASLQGPWSQAGDLTVRFQRRLSLFHEGGILPTISVAVDETFPTGRYDQLRATERGIGSGAYQTTLSVYSQYYFWLQNGRILRARLDFSYSIADDPIDVKDRSVYGTALGFRGSARLGSASVADLSLEYSLAHFIAPAIDVIYEHDGSTELHGVDGGASPAAAFAMIDARSPTSDSIEVAPALEFSWSGHLGVVVGVAATVAGRNAPASFTPMLAINYAY